MIQHYNPYLQNSNILPPQQIIQANGKQSIDSLRMSPNSSALIADTTAPIVWRCVSDGLGNVTAQAFDILPHKSEEEIEKDNLTSTIKSLEQRVKELESKYEQSNIKRVIEPNANDAEREAIKKSDAGRKKSAGAIKSDDAE